MPPNKSPIPLTGLTVRQTFGIPELLHTFWKQVVRSKEPIVQWQYNKQSFDVCHTSGSPDCMTAVQLYSFSLAIASWMKATEAAPAADDACGASKRKTIVYFESFSSQLLASLSVSLCVYRMVTNASLHSFFRTYTPDIGFAARCCIRQKFNCFPKERERNVIFGHTGIAFESWPRFAATVIRPKPGRTKKERKKEFKQEMRSCCCCCRCRQSPWKNWLRGLDIFGDCCSKKKTSFITRNIVYIRVARWWSITEVCDFCFCSVMCTGKLHRRYY